MWHYSFLGSSPFRTFPLSRLRLFFFGGTQWCSGFLGYCRKPELCTQDNEVSPNHLSTVGRIWYRYCVCRGEDAALIYLSDCISHSTLDKRSTISDLHSPCCFVRWNSARLPRSTEPSSTDADMKKRSLLLLQLSLTEWFPALPLSYILIEVNRAYCSCESMHNKVPQNFPEKNNSVAGQQRILSLCSHKCANASTEWKSLCSKKKQKNFSFISVETFIWSGLRIKLVRTESALTEQIHRKLKTDKNFSTCKISLIRHGAEPRRQLFSHTDAEIVFFAAKRPCEEWIAFHPWVIGRLTCYSYSFGVEAEGLSGRPVAGTRFIQ